MDRLHEVWFGWTIIIWFRTFRLDLRGNFVDGHLSEGPFAISLENSTLLCSPVITCLRFPNQFLLVRYFLLWTNMFTHLNARLRSFAFFSRNLPLSTIYPKLIRSLRLEYSF